MADPHLAEARERIGSTLKERWVLDGVLGVGGMAAVFSARHRNGMRVAVKVLHQAFSEDVTVRERFLREAYLANSVGHSGVAQVLDDDADPKLGPFLVMELLDGATLLDLLDQGVQFNVPQVLDIADQSLDVLAHAHDRGIVHRDFKPANLFLCRNGVIKVLDFGIARLLDQGSKRLTRTGVPIGTPAYMAPEQARGLGHEVDGRADVYAVGATMFRALAGRHVHVGRGVEQIAKVAMQRAQSLGEVMPGLNPDACKVIDRALEFEVERRYADARAMQADVRDILEGRAPKIASIPLPAPTGGTAMPAAPTRRSVGEPKVEPKAPSQNKDAVTMLAESARERAHAVARRPDAFSARPAPLPSIAAQLDDDDDDNMPTMVAGHPKPMLSGVRPLALAFRSGTITRSRMLAQGNPPSVAPQPSAVIASPRLATPPPRAAVVPVPQAKASPRTAAAVGAALLIPENIRAAANSSPPGIVPVGQIAPRDFGRLQQFGDDPTPVTSSNPVPLPPPPLPLPPPTYDESEEAQRTQVAVIAPGVAAMMRAPTPALVIEPGHFAPVEQSPTQAPGTVAARAVSLETIPEHPVHPVGTQPEVATPWISAPPPPVHGNGELPPTFLRAPISSSEEVTAPNSTPAKGRGLTLVVVALVFFAVGVGLALMVARS